ncbi:hypothetical protein [Vibrio phage vB_VpaP_SJSY21]|nr:hypothetical protein [Vibrio phage vB_VpaP_SJSY21]
MMFSVNDRVKLVNLTDPNGGEYVSSTANTVGNVGKITYNEGEDWYTVQWDNGSSDSFHKTNLVSDSETAETPDTHTAVAQSGAMWLVKGNDYCVPEGEYEIVEENASVVTVKNNAGQQFQLPASLKGTVIVPNKTPDQIIEEHLDEVTAPRPERSMVEYSLSVNRSKLEKLTTVPEFPNRDWSKSNSKDETVISRLRVKGFSVHSIAIASGLSYEQVLEITNRVLKP